MGRAGSSSSGTTVAVTYSQRSISLSPQAIPLQVTFASTNNAPSVTFTSLPIGESGRRERLQIDRSSLKKLGKYGLLELMVQWLLDEVCSRLRQISAPHFDRLLSACAGCAQHEVEDCMRAAVLYVHGLHQDLQKIFRAVQELSRSTSASPCVSPVETLELQFHVLMFPDGAAHDRFTAQVRRYLEIKFTSKYSAWKKIRSLKKVLRQEKGEVTEEDEEDSAESSDDEDVASMDISAAESFDLNSFGHYINEIGKTFSSRMDIIDA